MEVDFRDRNGDEDMLQHANEEVAVDIPIEEANDVTIQSASAFREGHRSRTRSIRVPSRPPVSSRSLTWAVPVNTASFNTDPSRRDENNGAELQIRTGPGDGENNAQTAIRSNGKPLAIDDSNASSEKTAFQFAAVFAALTSWHSNCS
uniref:Uncharacterized protein n=1 Tax=Panagrolaimus superbus TaxID=310955 RepID=A0A914YKU2_9BILA